MRLDARKGDFPWNVWHVERGEPIKQCVWADDESNEWGEYTGRIDTILWEAIIDTHQARKIVICPDVRVVLINPIEDTDDAGVSDAVSRGTPTAVTA